MIERALRPLFWTQFLGAMNDNVFRNILALFITYRSITVAGLAPEVVVSLCGGIFILPFLLFSSTAGQLVDRYPKDKMMKIVKIFEIVIMIFGALGFIFGIWGFLLIVLFLMGAQSSFFGPIKYGMVPELVTKDRVPATNAWISGGTFVAILLGTIIGGGLVSLRIDDYWMGIAVVVFAIMGFVSSLFQKPLSAGPELPIDFTFIKSTWSLFRESLKNKKILKALIGISWFWLIGSIMLALILPIGKNLLGGKEAVTTFFLALYTIGMGTGSAIAAKISEGRDEVGLVPWAAIGMAFFFFILGLSLPEAEFQGELMGLTDFLISGNAVLPTLAFFGASLCGGSYIIPQMTYIQFHSPQGRLAQMIAANNIWNALFMVLGSVGLSLFLQAGHSIVDIVLVFSSIILFSSFVLYGFYMEKTIRFIFSAALLPFYRIKIEGKENFPANGPYIITSNHVSFIDWLFVMLASPLPVRFVIDHQYYYAPTLAFWFRQARLIPIAPKRENEERLKIAMETIYRDIKAGHVLGFFPEGTITRNGELKKFQPGLSKIVKESNVTVVPMALGGLWGSWFSRKSGRALKGFPNPLRRRKIVIKVGKPISPEVFNMKELHRVIGELRVKA